MNEHDMEACLAGEALYGDSFGLREMEQWYADEREAYANLGALDRDRYRYGYHQLNVTHCYRYLPDRTFDHVLGFGAAYGEELLPIIDRIKAITILDPSDAFEREELHGVPVSYERPRMDGSIAHPDACFDLVTCFGVLHHVPSVTRVLREFARCLEPGGFVLLREPTVSMGDWRKPRPGLTKHERGIPLPMFRKIVASTGLEVVREARCMFSLTGKLAAFGVASPYNSRLLVLFDRICCRLFAANQTYHATGVLAKLRPVALALVLRKPHGAQP